MINNCLAFICLWGLFFCQGKGTTSSEPSSLLFSTTPSSENTDLVFKEDCAQDISLGSIVFFNTKKWTAWINQQPINHEQEVVHRLPQGTVIQKVWAFGVTFYIHSLGKTITLRPNQTYCATSQKICEGLRCSLMSHSSSVQGPRPSRSAPP